MYASAHWDLIREAQAERLRGAATAATEAHAVTPARLTTWGARASRRAGQPAAQLAAEPTAARRTGDDRVVRIPAPRDGRESAPSEAATLLDA